MTLNIDGSAVGSVTIDGTSVKEVTIDGSTVYTATRTIESFEDSDMAEYTFGTGSASDVNFVSAIAPNGTVAAEVSGSNVYCYSMSGLPNYPVQGDTVRFWMESTSPADDVQFRYGVQESNAEHYGIRADIENDEFIMKTVDGGNASRTVDISSGFTFSHGTLYRVELDWNSDGSHNGRVIRESDDTQIVSGGWSNDTNDPANTSGGVGWNWYLGSGGSIIIDGCEIV